MTLDEFEKRLETLVGKPTTLRPFVCDGSPLACRVFIVGFNPATHADGDFWDNWVTGVGFAKERWHQAYLTHRRDRPLAPGKKRRLPISPTRRRLMWIEEEARGTRILETNIFASASATKAELALQDQCSRPFRFLVETIDPNVIVAHGVDAHAVMDQLNTKAKIIKVPHLSRGWSEDRSRELGRSLGNLGN